MFTSINSFAAFFFTCLTLIILGIVFEEKLIALEKKFDAWWVNLKRQIKKSRKETKI